MPRVAPGGFLIFAMVMGKALGSQLHGAMTRVSDAPLRGGNELGLLENGPATYEDWLAMIEDARRWVHLENYIFRADGIGRRFANVLCAKVREGVPVRVLYDWFGSWDVPRSFWEELRWAGVEVRAVNPLTLQEPLDFLRRDHRKLLAVDGAYASAGGVCIGDEWLRRSPETGLPYRDTAVSVRGPAVADLERAFAGVWDQSGPPLPNGERPAVGDIPPVGGQEVRVVIQEPGKARVLRILELLMAEVQERMWIADAYFLSIPTLTQSLMAAARDGVDVRILLPATNDLPWIGVLSRIGYQQLLEAGVRIYEYGGLMMHAKTSITDGLWGRVGSTNLNVSGLLANWEVDILAEDRSFGAGMEAMFEKDLADAREILLRGTRGTARRPLPRPERPISRAERRVQRETPGSGPRVVATASRVGNAVGNAVLTASGGDPLNTHERAIGAALAAGAIGVSALGVRYPRLLAWPLAGAGGFAGSLGLLHVAQRAWSERNAKGTNRGR
jgi:cardiolipin synthase